MVPPSQKDRPISFYLTGGGGAALRVDLVIRPEELARNEPSRLQIQQTLGGAWADNFDRGAATITLSGTTGWRGGPAGSGEDQFARLRNAAFQGWHDRRSVAIASGIDPNTVKLYFIDNLDTITAVVAPREFRLQRSRTTPLLMQFHIALVVLDDMAATGTATAATDPVTAAFSNPLRWVAAIANLDTIDAALENVLQTGPVAGAAGGDPEGSDPALLFGANAAVAQAMIMLVRQVLNVTQAIAAAQDGRFEGADAPVLSTASSLCQAACALFRILAAGAATASTRAGVMQIASLLSDSLCTLANGFNMVQTYPSFETLYGASNCSSTGGGRPASDYIVNDENPFLSIFPVTTSRIQVSPSARDAITTLSGDPLALRADPVVVGTMAGDIVAGVAVSS